MASISATTAIIAAVAAASAGTTAYSAVAAGENAKETADYNKQVADNAAQDALQRGSIAAAEHKQKVRQLISQQNAEFSAGGIDASTGTPLEIMTQTAGMGQLDALRILNNAQRTAGGYTSQGNLDEFQGNAAQRAGAFGAAGSILGGAASAARGYYGNKVQQTNY